MNRDERDEQIWLYAAGALSEAEMQSVRALLEQGDADDLASLAAARETLARLPESLDPVEPSPAVLQRLMARTLPTPVDGAMRTATATGSSPATRVSAAQDSSVRPAAPRRHRLPYWLAAAAACVAVAGVWFGLEAQRETRRVNEQLALALATLETQRVQSGQQLEQLLAQSKLLQQPNLQLTQLAAGDESSRAGGRVLWDQANHRSHVYVFNLAPPKPGNAYQLWFIEKDKAPVPAGTFMVDAQGNGQIIATVPAGMRVAAAAITEEPAGGSQTPTMPIKLVGNVQ